jgi:GNAT superfamily N-acetyltransferase
MGSTALWVGSRGGDVVGLAQVNFLEEENSAVAIAEVIVHPDHRRAGFGTTLLRTALPELKERGCRMVEGWHVVAGTSGQWWAEALAFRPVRKVARQVLVLADAERFIWEVATPAGYRLQQWTEAVPEDLLDSYAVARGAIQDAPMNESAYQWPEWTGARVRKSEAECRRKGIEQRVVAAIHEATGAVAGFTEVAMIARRPDWAYQRDTAVLAAHRGRGLGRCLKAAMTRWLVSDRSDLERIATGTSADNAHMIRVNHEVGYTTLGTLIAFQLDLATLEARLDDRAGSGPSRHNV